MRSLIPILAIALSLTIPNVNANDLDTSCWYKTDNQKQSYPGGPCGVISLGSGYKPCCAVNDTCLSDGVCQYTHAGPTQGQTTGYYVGGCTDPSLQSSNCNSHCSSFNFTDIVYNKTTDRWHCCGSTDGVIHCDEPEAELFDAPGPVHMGDGYYTVPSAVSTAAVSTTYHKGSPAAATASTMALTVSKSASSSDSLSTGAKAGIGIGAAVGGLAIIGLIVFFALRHRRNTQGSYNGAKEGPSPVADRGALVEPHRPENGNWNGNGNGNLNMQHVMQSPMSQNSTIYSDISSGMGDPPPDPHSFDSPVVPISEDSRGGYGSGEYPPEKESYGGETIIGRQELRGNEPPRHELA
ncbi:hypothetical protein LARI1_G006347 [Lachnellula arida]|uniref:Carcinoembryonic antigen-related cell adhesion molecule 1 n=1 Tax=Lachnellula arida TaxID=1316785 RepID=A0A8T9B8C3_9HELO|nr:hypothetical protein LARI1_G006347 [Lachnellula arida]